MSGGNTEGTVGSPTHWATDLQLLLVSLVLLWGVTLLPVVRETPLRIVVALVVALFVPGYALIAALFPECGPSASDATSVLSEETGSDAQPSGIDVLERFVLSFGASIAMVPLVGLVLNFTPWGLRLVPILVGLTSVTVPLTILAAVRRARLLSEEQFDPHPVTWLVSELRGLTVPEDRTDAMLNVLLVVSVLLAVGSVAYAATDPAPEEEFTEFYLLTENETGSFVATDYPTNFTTEESQSLVVGIGNEEGRTEKYTVVTQLQAVEIADGTVVVTDSREIDRFSRELSDGASVNLTREITPRELTGARLRLQFLLYRGEAPDAPNPSSAYRETHLWVNVTAADPG